MKTNLKFEKLTRSEMSKVSGGQLPADCINACYGKASDQCNQMSFGGNADFQQTCYMQLLASCMVNCGSPGINY